MGNSGNSQIKITVTFDLQKFQAEEINYKEIGPTDVKPFTKTSEGNAAIVLLLNSIKQQCPDIDLTPVVAELYKFGMCVRFDQLKQTGIRIENLQHYLNSQNALKVYNNVIQISRSGQYKSQKEIMDLANKMTQNGQVFTPKQNTAAALPQFSELTQKPEHMQRFKQSIPAVFHQLPVVSMFTIFNPYEGKAKQFQSQFYQINTENIFGIFGLPCEMK